MDQKEKNIKYKNLLKVKMAKGARNKYKKRMRSAKAAHLYTIRGKGILERLNGRMNDPTYQMQSEYTLPPNAYLEPNNPLAVFP